MSPTSIARVTVRRGVMVVAIVVPAGVARAADAAATVTEAGDAARAGKRGAGSIRWESSDALPFFD